MTFFQKASVITTSDKFQIHKVSSALVGDHTESLVEGILSRHVKASSLCAVVQR